MNISLNFIKRFVDIPAELKSEQIAYDLTMRTVEVEGIEKTRDKFNNIVVGQIKEVKAHPNADALRICIVDVGDGEDKQIVCGGSNLYEGEKVVVSKPGSMVVWHGEGEPVKIKETKMRGEASYGMICGATEVSLADYFTLEDERMIVDLSDYDCVPGQCVAEVFGLDDVILEVDNKSLTNRPDLWGHYGIAREIAAIYELDFNELPAYTPDKSLPSYDIEILNSDKCPRYMGIRIDNLCKKESPAWMKSLITNAGMRPINAIVDITNFVLLSIGQPTHAFDSTHVDDNKIIVRNAKHGETLLLLDELDLDLTDDDLVICDSNKPLALAGIKGGKYDSILDDTKSVLLEVANFSASTIRQTGRRFDEKTDASIRYEKGIDTQRVDIAAAMALKLFKEIFPESEVVAFCDNYPVETKRSVIEVSKAFLDERLGKVLSQDVIEGILRRLGYDVTFENGVYTCIAPTWRSTGDVGIKDDVMGDIARLLSYESFEAKPLPVNFEHSVNQIDKTLARRLREFLAYRCGFNEIFTYPWVEDRYLNAADVDLDSCVKLSTPPSPTSSNLRPSLIPGMLEAVEKNIRYFDEFKIFEAAQIFEKGEYHPSNDREILPIHRNMLTGGVVGKDAKDIFFQVKGVIEAMPSYCHAEGFKFNQTAKPTWADEKVWLNVCLDNEVVGAIGLLSVSALSEAGIKRTNVAAFEIDTDKLVAFPSRTNEFKHLPQYPLVEKDLSLLVDETMSWKQIEESIDKMVKEVTFVEEYRGEQIPDGKKSIMLSVKFGNDDSTMTSKQIDKKMVGIIKQLEKKCKAILRED